MHACTLIDNYSVIISPLNLSPVLVPGSTAGSHPRILARMKADNEVIPKACLQVTHILADSEVKIQYIHLIQLYKFKRTCYTLCNVAHHSHLPLI